MAAEPSDYEARLMRKVTWNVVPFLCVCFLAAFLDRVNVGFAKEALSHELKMDSVAYGTGAGIFFIGYFLFEVPSNLILARVGARTWIARIMIMWAFISAAFAFIHSENTFYVLRFFLGAAEAGFFPGVIYYLTKFFPSEYRSRTVALFMMSAAAAGVVGGLLSGVILDMDGWAGFKGYQWLFVIEALPSLVLGVMLLMRLPNGPEEAKWLEPSEKSWLAERLAQGNSGEGSHAHTSFAVALLDPRVLILCFVYFTHVIAGYGLDFFMPTLIKGLFPHVSGKMVGVITGVPSLFALAVMSPWGRSSDKRNERRWHYALAVWWAAVGLVIVSSHAPNWLCVIALGLAVSGRWSAVAPFWGLSTAFLSGTAAAGAIALINAVGNLGGFYGPFLMGWFEKTTGSHDWGLRTLAVLVFAGGLVAKFGTQAPARDGTRLGRLGFAVWLILQSAMFASIAFVVSTDQKDGVRSTAALIALILIVVVGTIFCAIPVVKRLHDLERPGTQSLLLLVPFYNFYLLATLLFQRGTRGKNKYGSDPVASVGEVVGAAPLAGVQS